jgi:hypothetical protein
VTPGSSWGFINEFVDVIRLRHDLVQEIAP